MSTVTPTPGRCPRCEQPHGTCHHTAPPIAVGDVIDEATMNTGRGVRMSELRSNSRVRDPDGDVWVKTRRRDGAWECLRGGDIAHLHQIAWPLTVEHVAGRRA
jgi:hypothetical protein